MLFSKNLKTFVNWTVPFFKKNNPHRYKYLTIFIYFVNKFSKIYTNIFFLKNYYLLFYNSHLTTYALPKNLLLNFKRYKFFPAIYNNHGHTYTILSLGIFLYFFQKPKSFKKSKQLYLLLTQFLKKLIFYSGLVNYKIIVKHTPKYLKEMLNILLINRLNIHTNPFSSTSNWVNSGGNSVENVTKHQIPFINNLVFFNTKHYGYSKTRKKGTVKRKIYRKVIKNNLITD